MNPATILSISLNMLSITIMITSSSWFTMWMSFELNMISFIPMMMNKNNNSTAETMMKYFMIQTIGSILMILAILLKKTPMMPETTSFLITLAMITKMGAFPIFQWLPSVSEGLSWMTLTLLLTTQKIMPFSMLTSMSNTTMIILSASASALMGSLGGFNQTMTRKMMAYSSITHMGWMLMILNNKSLLIIYITIYSLIVLSTITYMKDSSSFKIMMENQKKSTKMIMISMLSLGGMPPLLGFIPKLLSINWLAKNNMMTLPLLIMGSLINLSFYMNIMMKSMIMSSNSNNLKKNHTPTKISMIIPSMTLTLTMLMI